MEPAVREKEVAKDKPMTRLELLAGQMDMFALTPEIQAPQKTFAFNLSFWKLCLEARKMLNEEKRDKSK